MTDPTPDGDAIFDTRLSEADAAALDRVLSGDEVDDARDRRVAGLLSLLGTPVAGESKSKASARAESVRARIEAAGTRNEDEPDAVLSEEDGEALDAWALHGYSCERTPAPLRDRAERHEQLATLLALATPGETSEASRARLAGVQNRIRDAESVGHASVAQSLRLDERPERGGLRFRLPEVLSVAAVLAIAVGVAIPVIARFQQESLRLATASDFGAAATAFGSYAADHQNALPVYSEPGAPVAAAGVLSLDYTWWNTGDNPQHSNSANLFTLVRLRYAKLEDLASPGNPNAPVEMGDRETDWKSRDEVSYSYRVVARGANGESKGRLTDPGTVVLLTDRSPLKVEQEGRVTRSSLDVNASSPNHNGRGQYRLLADGSAAWSDSPWLETNDNLWLPRQIERLQERGVSGPSDLLSGRELPEGPDDAFVGP